MSIETIKTPHYTYNLKTIKGINSIILLVGSEKRPCVEVIITTPDIDERLRHVISTASMSNIEALEECAYEDLTNNYTEKYSFGTELLHSIIKIIKERYTYVKKINLNDKSYIPCRRDYNQTLDLLTYSIALYGKTWYEIKANAYLSDNVNYIKYKEQVKKYMSEDEKSKTDFIKFVEYIQKSSNRYTREIILSNLDKYEELYNKCKTFSEFFNTLKLEVSRKDRCNFFKTWLENFINDRITIHRGWTIDIIKDSTIGGKYYKKRNTIKNKNK